MKLRIAVWACAGALVVIFWSFYISVVAGTPNEITRLLKYLTCPISLGGRHALSIYLVLVVNSATYALVGTAVEVMRRHNKTADVA